MSSSGMTIEALYVVDTHALIWYLIHDKKLGTQAAYVFAAAENGETMLVIPSIALAEMYYANKKNQWFPNFAETLWYLRTKPFFRFMSFEDTHVDDFDLDAAVPEMHDRIIAGLARRLGAPLLTYDPLIRPSGVVTVIW